MTESLCGSYEAGAEQQSEESISVYFEETVRETGLVLPSDQNQRVLSRTRNPRKYVRAVQNG